MTKSTFQVGIDSTEWEYEADKNHMLVLYICFSPAGEVLCKKKEKFKLQFLKL